MNITAMSLTNGTLTVIVDNGAKILTARNDHPNWTEIQEAYRQQDSTRLLTLLSLQAVVEEYSVGQLSINGTGITYAGRPMHTVDSQRVLAFLREGLPFKPIANYMERKMKNPSSRAITELYSFLEHKNMPITPEGNIIAYKGVQFDFYSITGNKDTIVLQGKVNEDGKILNEIGAVIEVERSSVDDNFLRGCSHGLHAGSLSYAIGFGQRLILVSIDPADVVSVPSDSECQKLRCCKYTVIGEYTGPMPHTYTSEFSNNGNKDVSFQEAVDPIGGVEDDDEEDNDTYQCYCGSSSCPKCRKADGMLPGTYKEWVPFTDEDKKEREKSDLDMKSRIEKELADAKQEKENNDNNIPTVIIPDTVTPKLLEIMEEQFGNFIVQPDISLVNLLDLDELDEVELSMAIEEAFGFEIPDEDTERMYKEGTFSDLVDYIRKKTVITTKSPGSTSAILEQTYNNGKNEGAFHRSTLLSPKYLPGDETAADSLVHAKYIEGYVFGYG